MKPVFKEEMNFLNMPDYLSGYLWVDKRCFYGFNKKNIKIKFGRSLESLPQSSESLITHSEFCNYYFDKNTKNKVDSIEIELLNHLKCNYYDDIIISVSGGKDSTVLSEVVSNAIGNIHSIRYLFGNTSNETHYTYRYVKEFYGENLEISNPKIGFYQWVIDSKMIPSRIGRACCTMFKEGNISNYCDDNKKILHMMGMRKSESTKRSEYKSFQINPKWNKTQKTNWICYLPILEFDDLDIWSYIITNKIDYNKLYDFGYGRVGCTNCPYRTDYELSLNRYFLPTYSKRWDDIIGNIFEQEGKAVLLNCTKNEFVSGGWRSGIFRKSPTKEVIEEYAHMKGFSYEVAERFFKNNICDCGRKLSRDVIALNMKIFGRQSTNRLCLKCLATNLKTSQKELKEKIRQFKKDECSLF